MSLLPPKVAPLWVGEVREERPASPSSGSRTKERMANHKSAIKRIRQTEKRRAYNRTWRSRTRTFVKKARSAQQATDVKAARSATTEAIAELDKAASKG